jgi:hypothetical protein
MRLVGTVTVSAAALVVLAAGLWVFGECRYRAGASDQRLKAAGDTTDVHRARLVARVVELEAQLRLDSAAQAGELAAAAAASDTARRRGDSLEAALRARGPLPPEVLATLEAKNVAIAQLVQGGAAKDRTILFWQGVAGERAAQRDSALTIAAQYRQQRDAWRKKARPRCTSGVAVGYALGGQRADVMPAFVCQVTLADLWPF